MGAREPHRSSAEAHPHANLPLALGDFASAVEALLRSAPAVRMQDRWSAQTILRTPGGMCRKPMPLAPTNTVMPDKHVRIDAPALPMQGVRLCFGERTGEDLHAHHWR